MAGSILGSCIVYALSATDDAEIRYIGQTKRSLAARLSAHLYCARTGGRSHRENWIRSVLRRGVKVVISPLHVDAVWGDTEVEMIAAHRAAGARLVNSTAGGDGVRDMPPEVRRRIGDAHRGRKFSDERRARMSAAGKLAGISDDHRKKMVDGIRRAFAERGDVLGAKISAAMRGREVPASTRAAIAAALRGIPRPESVRRKLSEIHTERFKSVDERLRTSALTRAGMKNEAVQEKIRAAAAARWADPNERAAQSQRITAYFSDPSTRVAMSARKAKLTDQQVQEARLLRQGGASLKDLCAMYGICKGPMSMLCRGITYRHVPMPGI